MEIVESLAPGKAMLQIPVIKPFEARNTVEFSARRILERKELLSSALRHVLGRVAQADGGIGGMGGMVAFQASQACAHGLPGARARGRRGWRARVRRPGC
jgi:hypothetical protein